MSLYAALNSAVSGLTAQSSALSVISANIANASTTGYKTADSTFDTLVAASSANLTSTDGEGVTTNESQEMSAQGEIASTTTATNMAINGTGFFVASTSATSTAAGTDVYTRNGSWTQDVNGYLVNTSGDYLMGYQTDASGDVLSASAGTLAGLTAVKIPTTTTVTPSTSATLSANLPADLAAAGTQTTAADGTVTTSTGIVTSSSNVVDSLGVTQQIGETWTKGATNPTTGDTTWTLALSAPTSTTTSTTTSAAGVASTSTTSTGTVTGAAPTTSASVTFNSSGVLVSSTQTTAGVTTTNATPGALTGITLSLNSGATSTFALNLSGLTQTASTDGDAKISITASTSNGSTAGSLASVAVADDGDVTATYSNGSNVVVAKVPVATFANQNGLQELNGSTYAATGASGTATLSSASTNGAGAIEGEALEGSNTDTATEFNKMIVAQQAYSAAAQVVTYVDKMFESLIQAVG